MSCITVAKPSSQESPLYDLSPDQLCNEKFELVVIMEGTIETSSMTFQAR